MKSFIKKRLLLIFTLALSFQYSYSQSLKGTNWTRIKSERKDGSKYFDRFNSNKPLLEYKFRNNSVDVFFGKSMHKVKYEKIKQVLKIGKLKFKIDVFDEFNMVLIEMPQTYKDDDKIAKYHFIRTEYLNQYLKKSLIFINDSTVIAHKLLKVEIKSGKNIDDILYKSISNQYQNSYLIGKVLIDTKGNIYDVSITDNYKVSEKIQNEFKQRLSKIKLVPLVLNKPYNRLVDYVISFKNVSGFSTISFNFHESSRPCLTKCDELTIEEANRSQSYFIKGNELFHKNEFEKAIKYYNKACAIDRIMFDSFYNRAFCFLKLNNTSKACEDFKYLSEMGQKEGTSLFNKFCK